VHTDANNIAGLLEEIFGHDMTAAEHACQACRTSSYLGAHRLYRGAGLVLRCPVCDELALCIAARRQSYAVELRGMWRFGSGG
jgi:Family of unknown function (DUF6510)